MDVSHLQPVQQREIKALLASELFQEKPGFTTLVQHKVHLKADSIHHRKSYRIPERLLPKLKKEMDMMMQLGIIEMSTSKRGRPTVLVPKKDRILRFCIVFRYLNTVSRFESYPMPRIYELLEQVGNATFITAMDLSKGYWQVASSNSR